MPKKFSYQQCGELMGGGPVAQVGEAHTTEPQTPAGGRGVHFVEQVVHVGLQGDRTPLTSREKSGGRGGQKVKKIAYFLWPEVMVGFYAT